MWCVKEKERKAIDAIKLASRLSETYYHEPLIICYSGGKDSECILHLALRAGIKFEVLNSHTTVDPPEVVYHIRDVKKELESVGIKFTIRKPTYKGEPTSMWKLIETKKMPPTRLSRYCCEVLKEGGTPNRVAAVGVRAAESKKRSGRDYFWSKKPNFKDIKYLSIKHVSEQFESSLKAAEELNQSPEQADSFDCEFIAMAKRKNEVVVNPIYEWTDADVWEYIRTYNVPYCKLYDEGFDRLGCLLCPLSSYKKRKREAELYPVYKDNYIKAFGRMLEARKKSGRNDSDGNGKWTDAISVYRWWMEEPTVRGQLKFTGIDMEIGEEE